MELLGKLASIRTQHTMSYGVILLIFLIVWIEQLDAQILH